MCSEAMPMDLTPPAQLPTGWRELPLRAVAETKFSNVDKLTKAGEQPVRLCNYTDVYNNDYITEDIEFMEATASQPEIDKFRLKVGDVIITKDSETPYDIGIPTRVDYAGDDLVCGYHLALLRPNQEVVDPDYLSKQLGHARLAGYFARMANGLTRYGLSIGAIDGAPIWTPPLDEQRLIGRAFRQIDLAIKHTEAVITKLRHVRAGLLYDLLHRGLEGDGCLRPPPVVRYDIYKDSQLGKIPLEWDVLRLEVAVEILDHLRVPVSAEERSKRVGTVPYYGANGQQGFIDGYLFDEPLVLIAEDGGNFDDFETRPIAYRITGKSWVNNHAHILRARAGFSLGFVFRALEHKDVRRYIAGSTRSKLTQGELRAIEIGVPRDPDEQQAIADFADAYEKQIKGQLDLLEKLKISRNGVIDGLLTGRLHFTAELEMQ